jgi:hypothetical protein
MIDHMTAVLEDYLDVKKTEVSFEQLWQSDPPQEAGSKSFVEYLDQVRYPLTSVQSFLAHFGFPGAVPAILLRLLPQLRRLQNRLHGQI